MTSYFRVRLGQGGMFTQAAVEGGFVGLDYGIAIDLGPHLPDDWAAFAAAVKPAYQAANPDRSAVATGLAVGMLWTLVKSMQVGDVVLSPAPAGHFHVGRVVGPYQYVAGGDLPHRRAVDWSQQTFSVDQLSPALWASIKTPLALVNATPYAAEIEQLLSGSPAPLLVSTDPDVEDVHTFALEKHLEDFLVANWESTELGQTHKIYEVDGAPVGQQFPTATGPIDILAVSHDDSELLVVELKRGRASDSVVGQVQRYMGFVQAELAATHQTVRGAIIALEDDPKVRYALAVAPNIDFFRYSVSFQLNKVEIQL